jgi:hypothetical protein
VFDDDFIDSYIELKMTEVERFEMTPAPGRVRDVLFGAGGRRNPRSQITAPKQEALPERSASFLAKAQAASRCTIKP